MAEQFDDVATANFKQRLQVLYSHWNKFNMALWGSADVLTIATPQSCDEFRYSKSSALSIWLFGYEIPDTIMVFMKKQIHFFCTYKNAFLLKDFMHSAEEALGIEVVVHVKTRKNNGAALVDTIFRAVRAQTRCKEPIVGHVERERACILGHTEGEAPPKGCILKIWADKVNEERFLSTDITDGISDLFEVKDEAAIMNVKKSACLISTVMEDFVTPRLAFVICNGINITHSTLQHETETMIIDPKNVHLKLEAYRVDTCYPPIFQSGGEYNFKPSALTNDEYLCHDSNGVILCSIGARCNSYCSNVARTYFVDANENEIKAYKLLLKAHEAAICALRQGNRAKSVYNAAFRLVKDNAPELAGYLTRSTGSGIGIELRESGICLNGWSERVLKVGMVFNVLLGFYYLKSGATNNPKTEKVSMMIGDTVIVGVNGPEVVTSQCSKAFKDVAFWHDNHLYCSEDEDEDNNYEDDDESKEDEDDDDDDEDKGEEDDDESEEKEDNETEDTEDDDEFENDEENDVEVEEKKDNDEFGYEKCVMFEDKKEDEEKKDDEYEFEVIVEDIKEEEDDWEIIDM